MIGQVLITNGDENGGVHPPAKLAGAYARNVMEMFAVSPEAGAAKIAEVKAFEAKVVAILTTHHEKAQNVTRVAIRAGAVHDDHGAHVDEAMADIVAAAAPFSFAPAMASEAVRQHLLVELTTAFKTTLHIEHSWHADRLAGRAHAEHMRLHGHATNPAAVHPAFVDQAKGA